MSNFTKNRAGFSVKTAKFRANFKFDKTLNLYKKKMMK